MDSTRIRRAAAVLWLGLAATAHAAPATSATPAAVGAVEKVQERAEATQAGAPRTLAVAGPVLFQDRLRTGPASRLEAKLEDGTVLTLGANGRMTVDEFVYRPGAEGGKLALSVTRGAFLFVGGKIEGPTGGNVSIRTPVGTLGVRGTTVWGGPIDGGYGVLVLKGEVRVATPRGAVTLREGQGTMVRAQQAPSAAGPWPEGRVKRAVATISFDPARQAAVRPAAAPARVP